MNGITFLLWINQLMTCLCTALLQSPVSSVTINAERFQSTNSRRRLFSGSSGSVPASPSVAATTAPVESETKDQNVEPQPNPSPMEKAENKPKRTGSLGLFFRKVNF